MVKEYTKRVLSDDLLAGQVIKFSFKAPKNRIFTGFMLDANVSTSITILHKNSTIPIVRDLQISSNLGYEIDGLVFPRQFTATDLNILLDNDIITGTVKAQDAGKVKLYFKFQK